MRRITLDSRSKPHSRRPSLREANEGLPQEQITSNTGEQEAVVLLAAVDGSRHVFSSNIYLRIAVLILANSAMRVVLFVNVCDVPFPVILVSLLTSMTGCLKGKRECTYPEPAPTKSSSPQGSRDAEANQQASPASSREDDDDDVDQDTKLSPIPDEDEEGPTRVSQPPAQPKRSLRHMSTASSLNLKRLMTRARQPSETPSLEGTKSASPTVSTGTASSYTATASQLSDQPWSTVPDLTHLPDDFRYYLDYFYENITNYHYGVHKDFNEFFRTTFIALAVRSEPLLHAVVAFAAYHQTIRDPNGRLSEFLKYYNRTVTLLLGLLKNGGKHDLGTLLTVLQLATIEVRNALPRHCSPTPCLTYDNRSILATG